MHVASLELCKELYELSGWDDCDNWASHKDMAFISDDTFLEMNPKWQKKAPAYDLGYLLRKLTPTLRKQDEDQQWMFFRLLIADGVSPEDAAAKLAIELFKQNILTKEPQS